MGLAILILGLAIFLGGHGFAARRAARDRLIGRIGRGPYRALFALVAVVGLVLIVYGFAQYRAEGEIPVWAPPGFLRHITIGLMLLASIFLVAFFIPSHVKAWLKHPLLNSVKTWALAHLLINGDLGGMILFGSFLVWGGYARVAAKRRGEDGAIKAPEGWINDALVVIVGIIVFLALGYAFHPIVIGVPVFGR
ncbi:MAG: NnrU family protein [Pseudolabrys sp.]|nr:NnrU family protein [Pseudolabrys sp.]